ncbi:hydrogenase maturation protease [Clostridium sp. YIM B02515]|uniref:Hydrogenase maturation protease n=1 Tax=Clostridium rhizosphaerae TaxID=2803861 RepID=A0ABS1TA14_9CLOT|nr:hydrogenase maturation protease [Clostridium rhizosphaerae]MBL4935937.1 hydrogenase maturation protease [Clostridium rhizosphaerae]
MSVKIIAIGNRLMGDDGLAIQILEKLSEKFEKNCMKVIIGETDFEYCLGIIEEKDYIIIVDATWFGIGPGTVTVNSLKDVYRLNVNQSLFSQHGYSLIKALEFSYRFIDGIIVGIEGKNFDYSFSLSNDIEVSFDNICNKVYETICSKVGI